MTMTNPTALSPEEVADLRSRMCGDKRSMTYEQASRVAWRIRHVNGHVTINAYPCPFSPHSEQHCWHVGHTPNIERMRLLARYLRFGAEA